MSKLILMRNPPFWFLLLLAAGAFLHWLIPADRFIEPQTATYGLGALLIGAGIWLNLWTDRIFKTKNVDVKPLAPVNRTLVTGGPFRFTRNPMYLGMLCILLGTAVCLVSPMLCAAAIAFFVVIDRTFIAFEEGKLHRQFGIGYDAFANRVRRWI